MTRRVFDIDIDVAPGLDRDKIGTRAMVYNEEQEKILPHPSGVYLEPVPVDELTGLCAFDHKYGDDQGYLKVDILTNTTYGKFQTKSELLQAADKEPDWSLLLNERVVADLPHLPNHMDVLRRLRPQSVEDLADVLAIIRPGKIHLLDAYEANKESVRRELYRRSSNGKPYFKKSHAISYAVMIVAALNQGNIFGVK